MTTCGDGRRAWSRPSRGIPVLAACELRLTAARCRWLRGERHSEGAPLTRRASDLHLATVSLGDLLHDGEPQAGAAFLVLADPVSTVEALKNARKMLGLDAE